MGEPEIGAAPGPASPDPDPVTIEAMHERLARITEMRDAVIYGDLARARATAETFAHDIRSDRGPPRWSDHMAALLAEAEVLVATTEPTETAASVARLATRCGNCHESLDVEPRLPEIGETPQARDAKTTMQAHQWSADRMWEGMIAPSDDRWVRGTTVFAVLPRCSEAKDRDQSCEAVRKLAGRAHVQQAAAQRGEAYGALLETCVGCHTRKRK